MAGIHGASNMRKTINQLTVFLKTKILMVLFLLVKILIVSNYSLIQLIYDFLWVSQSNL